MTDDKLKDIKELKRSIDQVYADGQRANLISAMVETVHPSALKEPCKLRSALKAPPMVKVHLARHLERVQLC